MNNKKSLTIPRITNLDSMPLTVAVERLQQSGTVAKIDSVNWPEKHPLRPLSTVTLAHSGRSLYALFTVIAGETRAMTTANLGPVADDTCFEIFVKHPDSPRYWNYEFNILGTANISSRCERSNPTRFSAEGIGRIARLSSCNTPHDTTPGLKAEWLMVKIPLDQIAVSGDSFPTLLEGNFYSCASAIDNPYYLSWNRIETPAPDFHRPEFFGHLILE